MEAWENYLRDLLLLVTLSDEITAKDFQPALTLPYLLPQIRCTMAALRIRRVSRSPMVALVEGQEHRRRAGQLGHHVNFAITHGKVHQCSIRERQQRLGSLALRTRQSVKTVLVNRVVNALGKVGLQLHCGHWQAIEEEHKINGVLVV